MSDRTLNRCSECGYTKADALIHWDHHLCKGKIPGYDTPEQKIQTTPVCIKRGAEVTQTANVPEREETLEKHQKQRECSRAGTCPDTPNDCRKAFTTLWPTFVMDFHSDTCRWPRGGACDCHFTDCEDAWILFQSGWKASLLYVVNTAREYVKSGSEEDLADLKEAVNTMQEGK